MAIRLSVRRSEVLRQLGRVLGMIGPVFDGNRPTHHIGALPQLRDEPIAGDAGVGIGEGQPPRATVQQHWAPAARAAPTLRALSRIDQTGCWLTTSLVASAHASSTTMICTSAPCSAGWWLAATAAC